MTHPASGPAHRRKHRGYLAAAVAAGALLGWAGTAAAQVAPAARPADSNGVIPRELVLERPTLIAQGFEWYVEGDENGNAVVTVSYRKKGEQAWHEAQPLLRINRLDRSGQYGPTAPLPRRPNLFSGSIFDLAEKTEYEARLRMSDPDGISGETERTISFATRGEPMAPVGGRVFHVYPPDHKGPVQQPAFVGIAAAYFDGGLVTADHYNVYPPRVHAGDVILMHAGTYKDNWHYYAMGTAGPLPASGVPASASCCGATFHGTYFLTAKGTAEKPIAIKSAGDGEVIIDGDGNDTLFNMAGGDYHYFEGLTFRNTKVAIQAGWKNIGGSSGLVVKRSRFENVGIGIHTDWSGSKDFYIADNTFIGRHSPTRLAPFGSSRTVGAAFAGPHAARFAARGVPPEASELKSEYAVKVYGSGNVIAYNRVENFHDGLTFATYGVPDGWPDVPRDRLPASNDFYNNVISNVHDDCIEVDGMLYNARVLRNLCVNAAGSGFSTQGPGLSGPNYIVRNIAYNIPGLFSALKTTGAPGLRVYNNTFAVAVRASGPSEISDFRNNLILSQFPEEPAYQFAIKDLSPTSDYNGFMAGAAAPGMFVRLTPAARAQPPVPPVPFAKLKDWSAATGNDMHSRQVDFGVFGALKPAPPELVDKVYDPASLDFVLRKGGKAVDAGTPIANVTEGFTGRSPDLGALELGVAPPHYGPRP